MEAERVEPPPGYEASGDAVADAVGKLSVSAESGNEDVDKPDLSLNIGGLKDEGEVTKRLADGAPAYETAGTWEDLNLPEKLLQGLAEEMKFERPSRVQAETLPMMLQPPHRHLIAQAQNGSGKTTCFAVGMLARVDEGVEQPQAVCMVPTRELCLQNTGVVRKIGSRTGIRVVSTAEDDRHIGRAHVAIGTPGRLKNHINSRRLSLKSLNVLVFDEADHMFDDQGFRKESLLVMGRAKQQAGEGVQVLLFSATFDEAVREFASNKLQGANQIFMPPEQLSLDKIKQFWVDCSDGGQEAKREVLLQKIFPLCERLGQAIIFVKTKSAARRLDSDLRNNCGWTVSSITGDLSQDDRDHVISEFRANRTKILVSTDVLARGFDHSSVTLIINFDLPTTPGDSASPDYDTYLHRIGRSGRFGRKGVAFNLSSSKADRQVITALSEHFSRQIPEVKRHDESSFEDALSQAGLADAS